MIRDKDTFKLIACEPPRGDGQPRAADRTIHVAGTVGKGSVSAMLQSCGYAVGSYTSPHLTDLRERIQIDGHMSPTHSS